MCAFFVRKHIFGAKNYKAARSAFVQNFGTKNALSYEKCVRKMLMKLTPGWMAAAKMQAKLLRVQTCRVEQRPAKQTLKWS